MQRLSAMVRRGSSLSAEDLMVDIYNTAADFCGDNFNDDVTILVVKCDFNGLPTLTTLLIPPRESLQVLRVPPECRRCFPPRFLLSLGASTSILKVTLSACCQSSTALDSSFFGPCV